MPAPTISSLVNNNNTDGLSSKKLFGDCKHLIGEYLNTGDWKKVDRRLSGTAKKRLKRLYSEEFSVLLDAIAPPLRKMMLFHLVDLIENSKSQGIQLEASKELNRRLDNLSQSAANSPLLKGNTTINNQNTYVLAVESLQQSQLGSQLLSKLLSHTTDNNTYQSFPAIEHNAQPIDIPPPPTLPPILTPKD